MTTHKIILKDGKKLHEISRVPFTRVPAVVRRRKIVNEKQVELVYRWHKYHEGKQLPHQNSCTEYQLVHF